MKTVQVRELTLGEGRPKIIVPVVGKTEEMILAEAKEAAQKAEIVEWRADLFEGVNDLLQVTALLTQLRETLDETPLLFTLRTKKEGGEFEGSKDSYSEIVKAAAEHRETDLVDIELSIGEREAAPLVKAANGKEKAVILSFHDFEKTPDKKTLVEKLMKMDRAGADILKIACMPKNEQDVLTLLAASLEMKELNTEKPMIAISMGEKGLISRLSGEVFGSVCTFGTTGQASAPGQIDAEEMRTVLETIHKNIEGEK